MLDPDGIPEDILVDEKKVVKLDGYPTSNGDYWDARAHLFSSSLISHNNEKRSLTLHRSIQETTLRTMDHQTLIKAFEAASRLVHDKWQFQSIREHHSVARHKECGPLYDSVLRLKNTTQDPTRFTPDVYVTRLIGDAGWYLFERGMLEEAKDFCECALKIAQQLGGNLGGPTDELLRQGHMFLGIILTETNEHETSMQHKQKWLNMVKATGRDTGDLVYELGYAYNEIGVAYGNNGDLEEAADAFRKSMKTFKDLEDFEDSMLGWPQPNLGFIYWLQGHYDKAERELQAILRIHESKYGPEDKNSFKYVPTGKWPGPVSDVLLTCLNTGLARFCTHLATCYGLSAAFGTATSSTTNA